jgi:hypothetical protein
MVEKKYYWPDFKDTFTVKTEEGMKHESLMDEYDCDLIMNYLMYAAGHLMTTSITGDVSYFKEHAFPYLPLYGYDPSILGGDGILKYIIKVDLINHVVMIMEFKVLTSFAELCLKSEGLIKESKEYTNRIMIDRDRFVELFGSSDENHPYKLFNNLRLALLTHFENIYNRRIYTEKTLKDLRMLDGTKKFLKSFQRYLKLVDESTTTYTHEEVMDLLLQQMLVIAPRDFQESVETY